MFKSSEFLCLMSEENFLEMSVQLTLAADKLAARKVIQPINNADILGTHEFIVTCSRD